MDKPQKPNVWRRLGVDCKEYSCEGDNNKIAFGGGELYIIKGTEVKRRVKGTDTFAKLGIISFEYAKEIVVTEKGLPIIINDKSRLYTIAQMEGNQKWDKIQGESSKPTA